MRENAHMRETAEFFDKTNEIVVSELFSTKYI